MAKYRNKKVIYNGIKFDSKKEAIRYQELILLQKAGEITDLKLQYKFELLPTQKEAVVYTTKTGKTKFKEKVIERKVEYIADFVYKDKNGNLVVEDVKSDVTRTKDYILKRKMLLFFKSIKIKEI